MTQEQIHQLFNQGYNQGNWKAFLGKTFTKTKLLVTPEILTGIDNNLATKVLKLGYVLLDESGIERHIAVYEVELAKGVIIERNRVGLRNLLRKQWTSIDAAFIVYYHPDASAGSALGKWRFTYVSELTGYDSEGNFQKTQTEPKRYTYLLGEGESIRTAVERFSVIAKKGSNATLEDVKEAFSVEKLSKAFFEEYKKHYDLFCDYMTKQPGIRAAIFNGDEKAIRDFNKKLLGRVVFLYFIQKKGWLGVPIGSKWGEGDFNFMNNLFEQHKIKDLFYNEMLTRLFFDTLNTKREDDIIELVKGEPFRIPYLNGGLFEPENPNYQEIIIKGVLFQNLFNFFNQYNFTIYEDDPNDHTVAVDPEMLGHIFENLLEDNKDKGAFYTPKEIVHYMCQESLIEYLCTCLKVDNEEREAIIEFLTKKIIDPILKPRILQLNTALDNVKICDPAIGSGAFPMGLLQEIFTAKQTLWHFDHGNLKDFPASEVKLNIIQNSIYGVDIEKGAVDIARLRFWLSLVVDEEEPKALPNLDYKIVVGNSLVSKLGDDVINIDWALTQVEHGLFGADLEIEKGELLAKISAEQKEFFNPHSDKKRLAFNIRQLKIDLLINQLDLMIATKGRSTPPSGTGKKLVEETELYMQTLGWEKSKKQLREIKNHPEKPLHFFDWKLDFPEVMNESINPKTGFDIVIGNPPYVQLQNNGGALAQMYEKSNYQTFARTGDIYCLFYERGWQLLNQGGHLCYITSNKWMRAGYGEKTREFLSTQTNPKQLIDFGGVQVFETATVDTNILLFAKENNTFSTRACVIKEKELKNLSVYVRQNETIIDFGRVKSDSWIVLSDIEKSIKAKIEAVGTPLKDWDINIYRGVLTGYNEAFIITGEKREEILANCKSEEEHIKTIELIRPILRGRDIKRYGYEWADLWLINTHNGIKEKGIKPIEIDDYPAVKNHLDKYYPQLESRQDKGDTPYNLRNCAYIEDFDRQKIIYPNMTKYMPFYLDSENYYTNQKCFILTGNNLAFLTAFLNSNVFKICYRNNFPELQGGTRELSKVFFENIKIPPIDTLVSEDFDVLVDDLQQGNNYADKRLERALLLALGLYEYEDFILNYQI